MWFLEPGDSEEVESFTVMVSEQVNPTVGTLGKNSGNKTSMRFRFISV